MAIAEKTFLSGRERTFGEDEIIVSKTDIKGRITYANPVFINLAGFPEKDLINAPHSLVRHPEMPRCVFRLLWETILAGREIFAYVINRSMNGDYYWVFAHVTPSRDPSGNIVGFHSNRRVPNRRVLDGVISPLYAQLLAEENRHANAKEGMNAAFDMMVGLLKSKGVGYDEFIFSL